MRTTILRFPIFMLSTTWLIACTNQTPAEDIRREISRYTNQVMTAINIANAVITAHDANANGRAHSSGLPYVKASIPLRIYECLREFSILRCTKLFVLQKMEQRKQFANSGNLTRDFIEQFFDEQQQLASLTNAKYRHMTEKELNQRLVVNFQRFFKNRDIKLHFLPGMMVKIVPSKENKLKFTLRKRTKTPRLARALRRREPASEEGLQMPLSLVSAEFENDADVVGGDSDSKQQGGGGSKDGGLLRKRKNKHKHSYKTAMLQMAVPILIMPAILLGSMLPFVLPALKMATIMSLLMNNGAFLAALIYAARTHANSQEEQHISYGYNTGGAYH